MGKIGLCLSGGGGKGAYQIGAVMALKEAGIYQKVNAFSGTSIGAANATLLASTSPETAQALWHSMPENVLKKNSDKPFIDALFREKIAAIDKGLYKIDALEDVLIKSIDQKALDDKEVYVTVSEVGNKDDGFSAFLRMAFRRYIHDDSKAFYLSLREMDPKERLKAVVASCSIPLIFPAVIDDEKRYYDGGVYDGVPIKPLAENGCDTIISIRLNPRAPYHPELYPGIRFLDIIHSSSIGSPLDFTPAHVKETYQTGYDDMLEYLDKLYFKP